MQIALLICWVLNLALFVLWLQTERWAKKVIDLNEILADMYNKQATEEYININFNDMRLKIKVEVVDVEKFV